MGIYGEVVLMKQLGKIPSDARNVRIPLFLEQHFGKVYRVSAVDTALLRGDYAKAYVLVERDMRSYFSKLLKDAARDGFPRRDNLESKADTEMILEEGVEGALKERYAPSAGKRRELCAFIEGKRVKKVVQFGKWGVRKGFEKKG